MTEPTKIDFHHRRIDQMSDFAELVQSLFPGNRNQQYAATCVLVELKWADVIVPKLAYLEIKYGISRRILQRTRSKLSRLGLIEHVSHLSMRHGGRHGWKLSHRFERSLRKLSGLYAHLRDTRSSSKEKDSLFVSFADARRAVGRPGKDLEVIFHRNEGGVDT